VCITSDRPAALTASLFDIVNRTLANTKVGSGKVEDINNRPLSCGGVGLNKQSPASDDVPEPTGLSPTATAGKSGIIGSQKPTATPEGNNLRLTGQTALSEGLAHESKRGQED